MAKTPRGKLSLATLPSPPTIALEVLALARNETSEFSDLENVIERDPALAAKILRAANSPHYGRGGTCSTLHQSLVVLGLGTVRTLTLGFSLIEGFGRATQEHDTLDYADFWRRAICSASASRVIASACGGCDADEAFLAALLADIGMIALSRHYGPVYHKAIAPAGTVHGAVPAFEREAFGMTHAEVTSDVVTSWGLPDRLAEAIAQHHDNGVASPLITAVQLGGAAAAVLTATTDVQEGRVRDFVSRTSAGLGLDDEDCTELLERIHAAAIELGAMFDVEFDAFDIEQIVLDAEEAIIRHQKELTEHIDVLNARCETFAEQASINALTSLGNRRQFDRDLAVNLHQANLFHAPLSLMFLDLDHFKQVNDRCGHQTGDRILRTVGHILADELRDHGTVARYGGEEFAALLPGADRSAATSIAEDLRVRIAEESFDLRDLAGSPIDEPLTISIGVATYEPDGPEVLGNPTVLVHVADQAVYAAKSAGRNCVQVFRPAA